MQRADSFFSGYANSLTHGKYSSYGNGTHWEVQYFPHLVERHPQFADWRKECPRHRTIHLKNGVKTRYTDTDLKTGGSDDLIKSQPHQIILELFQNIQCTATPPPLFEGAYPPWPPKVRGRVISSHIYELVQKG